MKRGQVFVRGKLPTGGWGNIDAFDMPAEEFFHAVAGWMGIEPQKDFATAMAEISGLDHRGREPDGYRSALLDLCGVLGVVVYIREPLGEDT